MSGTHVFYNGVELRDCLTKSFEQNVVLDEAKNLLVSQFKISVESLVFGFFYAGTPTPANPEDYLSHPSTALTREIKDTATDKMHIIQKRLSQPRKDFWYATHGGMREDRPNDDVYQILVAATGDDPGDDVSPKFFEDIIGNDITILYQDGYHESGGNSGKLVRSNLIDTHRGPITTNVKITELFGGRAFRVSLDIEVHRHLCLNQNEPYEDKPNEIGPDDNVQTNEFVISNTWSTEETRDEQWRISRTVEGTLRVRDQRYWSQGFRSLCLPGLMPGYRRMSQRFASDPTNLVLKYRIEDKQAEAAPPWPAIDWVMSHVDSAKTEYGIIERQLSIRLIGEPRAPRRELIAVALDMLDSRFQGATSPLPSGVPITQIRPINFLRQALIITQSSDRPEVEIMCNILMTTPGIGGFENAVESSSSQLAIDDYDPDNWPAPRPYDADSPAGIFACYMQNPCSQWHGMPQSQRLNLENLDTDNLKPLAVENASNYWEETDYQEYQAPAPFPQPADVNRLTAVSYPYMHVEIDSRYEADSGMMSLPLSAPRQVPKSAGSTQMVEQTTATIRVHAGIQHRVITVIATRHGRPPEIPEPAPVLIDRNGVVETLVGKSELILDAPRPSADQSHRVFSAQVKYKYSLARPLTKADIYRCANSPVLATEPGQNWIPGTSLFTAGRIEEQVEPTTLSSGIAAKVRRVTDQTSDPGQGFDPANPPANTAVGL